MADIKAKTAPILLKYDYWNADGDRLRAGAVVELETVLAKVMIAAGKAERADPMPGE